MSKSKTAEEWWYRLLTGDNKSPSRLTPHLCKQCQLYASQHLGGAEIELTMLFADVRGSTSLAGSMSPAEFSLLISRFFAVSADALSRHFAWVDRFVGDQAVGYFVPGFAGPDHARRAIHAAAEILNETGYHTDRDPWIPVGIGVHTGVAFVGSVGSAGQATDITALGDAANIAARLSSAAQTGEILISERTYADSGLELEKIENRWLVLKGKSEPAKVLVLRSGILQSNQIKAIR